MKSEKGTNRLTGEQIRTRKNSRIIIRILGLSIAVFGIFAFIGFFTNPEFGPNSPGTWFYLLTALLFGGGLFTLSFFVPKLYLPSETEKTQRTDPSSDRSTALWQKVDSELAAIEGTHTGSLHEPAPMQEHRQTYFCARCKKQLAEQDCVWIGNHRFCRDCAKASEHIVADTERYRDPKFAVALKTSDQSPLPNPPKQEKREIKCSRCGRDMPDPFHRIKDDGYRLCDQCRHSLRSFPVFYRHFEPCPQYQEDENLDVFVLEDRYLLLHWFNAGMTFSSVPFGFFAKSTGTEIAAKMNSIVPGGFCVPDKHALSADEIKNCEGFRVLIEYDRSRLASAPASEP